MRRLAAAALLLTAAAACPAAIDLPPTVPRDTPLIATVKPDVPPGATIRGRLDVHPPTATGISVGQDRLHVWSPPGTVTIRAHGVWVLTKTITVGTETVPVLVDFGFYDETATCTVTPSPSPQPEPQPNPTPGPRWALIIDESSQRTPATANLYLQLRQALPKQPLTIADRDSTAPSLRPYLATLKPDDALPLLIVAAPDGRILRRGPLPPDLQSAVKAITE